MFVTKSDFTIVHLETINISSDIKWPSLSEESHASGDRIVISGNDIVTRRYLDVVRRSFLCETSRNLEIPTRNATLNTYTIQNNMFFL
jgi:hypothetical protein